MKSSLSPMFLAILLASCNSNHPVTQEKISGIYIRETSFEVQHPETGKTVGRSTIRDTLFIKENQQGFQVSQAKWRLNDFDQQGWQNQQHAENRPTPRIKQPLILLTASSSQLLWALLPLCS